MKKLFAIIGSCELVLFVWEPPCLTVAHAAIVPDQIICVVGVKCGTMKSWACNTTSLFVHIFDSLTKVMLQDKVCRDSCNRCIFSLKKMIFEGIFYKDFWVSTHFSFVPY